MKLYTFQIEFTVVFAYGGQGPDLVPASLINDGIRDAGDHTISPCILGKNIPMLSNSIHISDNQEQNQALFTNPVSYRDISPFSNVLSVSSIDDEKVLSGEEVSYQEITDNAVPPDITDMFINTTSSKQEPYEVSRILPSLPECSGGAKSLSSSEDQGEYTYNIERSYENAKSSAQNDIQSTLNMLKCSDMYPIRTPISAENFLPETGSPQSTSLKIESDSVKPCLEMTTLFDTNNVGVFRIDDDGNLIRDKEYENNYSEKLTNIEILTSPSIHIDHSTFDSNESDTDSIETDREGVENHVSEIPKVNNLSAQPSQSDIIENESSDNESENDKTVHISYVEFDEDGHFNMRKIDTPGRLPRPEKSSDEFHFWKEQFLVSSDIFYAVSGGKVEYDHRRKRFVSRFSDRTQEDSLNYHAIRAFMKRLVKNGLDLRGCVLSFYGSIRENQLSVVAYAKCKYSSHDQRFKFEINDIEQSVATISIFATQHSGDITHEGRPHLEPLSGPERDYVKERLKHRNPTEYFDEVAKSIDLNAARDGDFQNLRRVETFRQVRAEIKNDKKRFVTSSDISDIMQRYKEDQRNSDPYIRRVGEPFHIHMYSREQLNTITEADKVAHLDATGSVVRKPDDNVNYKKCEPSVYKRVYYYALVIHKKVNDKKGDGVQIPILEMVTCEQDIASISLLLAKYKIFIHTEQIKWPLFRVIVVDWSWALIHAVLKEWTGMTIATYLKIAYNYATGKRNLPSDIILVHNCCAHFQNRVSKLMKTKFRSYKGSSDVIKDATGIMVQCQTIAELDMAYENFMILLLSKSSKEAKTAMLNLDSLRKKETEEGEDVPENESELSEDDREHGAVFANSPFYIRYFGKLTAIENKFEGEEDIDNEFYEPELAHYVTKNYMPYAPMWTALLLSEVLPGVTKLSNAVVEGYYNIVKHNVLQSKKKLAIGDFVEITRDYKSRTCTRFEIKELLEAEHPAAKQPRSLLGSPENPLAQESWLRKKLGRTRSHMEGHAIAKHTKQIKLDQNNHGTPIPKTHVNTKINRVDVMRSGSDLHSNALEGEKLLPESSTSSQDSIHPRALENSLFLDPDFYMQNIIIKSNKKSKGRKESNLFYYVGQYYCNERMPIIGTCFMNLCSQDYMSWKGEFWINGPAIDCYVIGKLHTREWKHITYIPTIETTFLIGSNYKKRKGPNWAMYHINESIKGTIFVPYVYDKHWMLLILDVENGTICHLDPTGGRFDRQRALNAFKKYLSECTDRDHFVRNNLCDVQWVEIQETVNRPMQRDGYNCGVYVLYYMERLAQNESMNLQFNPAYYRKQVMLDLLKMSRSMQYICYLCASDSKSWSVQCETCKRWTHLKCVNNCENDQTDYLENETASYICALCKNGNHPWTEY